MFRNLVSEHRTGGCLLLAQKPVFSFISSLVLILLHVTTGGAEPLWKYCPSSPNYSNRGTFGINLRLLFSSLPSNASATPTRFANRTTGDAPNRVYGLAQCRGDTTADKCRDCLNTAGEDLRNICPNRTGAVWYDDCLLRYSDARISSSSQNSPMLHLRNTQNVTDPARFNQLLGQLMNGLVSKAISVPPDAPLYATNQTNFTSFQTIYGLVQCTNNVLRADCRSCLQDAIGQIPACCDGKQGGRVLGPTCTMRFEIYEFYEDLALPPVPPPRPPTLIPPPPPTNETATRGNRSSSQPTTIIIAIAITIAIAVLLVLTAVVCCRRGSQRKPLKYNQTRDIGIEGNESLPFDFETVRAATDNFCEENKLGEGGFGAVYKGRLLDGQEIAVKRLSPNSGQGVQELKNEVVLLAKLHHRNLVGLLGFCIEGQEKLLIYEFVPNASLDNFLFNLIRRASLDWGKRYKIIAGIAQALVYLHEDSPLKIIHRDLKPSNILLDREMNTKISDFGLARIIDQTHVTASRVAGTRGYMAPEYAVHGQFSVKSDVFSFGVLVLEIVTGQKNCSFHESDGADNLISYAWKHWREGKFLELVDPTIRESCSRDEVMGCIHTALLCVRKNAGDRPTMPQAVLMLNSCSITRPDVSTETESRTCGLKRTSHTAELGQYSHMDYRWSANEVSITELEPR